jgi:protein required for attachment to host cells
MNNLLIAVIDGAKARFLTLEPAEFPDQGFKPRLVEHEELSNPTKNVHEQELWANVKSGRNRASTGQAHDYDDHRANHLVEFERRFAQAIATRITELLQIHHARKLILFAEPHILGLMRGALSHNLPESLNKIEKAKNLCHMDPHHLYSYLVKQKLL